MTEDWVFARTPFDELDRDWADICRQDRRSAVIARWANQEPELAHLQSLEEFIPPRGIDRTSLCTAVSRLYRAGDDLAGRALLQLLIPGMVVLTAKFRSRLPDRVADACWEVIGRTWVYIGALRERQVHCSIAGYILRSVERDLITDSQRQRRHDIELSTWANQSEDNLTLALPSHEGAICVRTVAEPALAEAFHHCRLPAESVETLRLVFADGVSVLEAAATTGQPVATAYRHRSQVLDYLRTQLFADESEETDQ